MSRAPRATLSSIPAPKVARQALGVAGALLAAASVLTALAGPRLGPAAPTVLGVLALGLGLAARAARSSAWALELGLLGAVAGLVQATGGVEASPLNPLVYVLVAHAASLASARLAQVTVAAALGLALLPAVAFGAAPLPVALAHAGFVLVFAALFAVLLRGEVRAVRAARDRAVREALETVERDARDFRLIGAALGPTSTRRAPEDTARARAVGSVRAIREGLLDVLEVARLGARADTASLFLLDPAGEQLELKECVAREGDPPIFRVPVSAREGALGAVAKTKRPVSLLPKGGKGLGYTTRAEAGSFLGVPVFDGEHVAGVLAVDRVTPQAFGAEEEEILAAVAREAQRTMESERIFAAMDRVKYEQERFHEAFALLNEALTPEACGERLLEAAARVKAVDFSAVLIHDAERREHRVAAIRAPDPALVEALHGARFDAAASGLVTMALEHGTPLPHVPLAQQSQRGPLRLFGPLPAPELASLKVFPLISRGAPLGALVVGSTTRGAELSREERRMLETVAAHASTTLANARLFARMEAMATSDALTGVANRRRFEALLEEALARAARFSRKVSVLMVDADHFKSINDTYGHPVGDLVLVRLAQILERAARRTDLVARYGGEEFVVVLDETDTEGATLFAERVRAKIEAEVIQGDFGRVRVTASLGLATWPDHANAREALLEAADKALYEAKRRGRNRVVGAR